MKRSIAGALFLALGLSFFSLGCSGKDGPKLDTSKGSDFKGEFRPPPPNPGDNVTTKKGAGGAASAQ